MMCQNYWCPNRSTTEIGAAFSEYLRVQIVDYFPADHRWSWAEWKFSMLSLSLVEDKCRLFIDPTPTTFQSVTEIESIFQPPSHFLNLPKSILFWAQDEICHRVVVLVDAAVRRRRQRRPLEGDAVVDLRRVRGRNDLADGKSQVTLRTASIF